MREEFVSLADMLRPMKSRGCDAPQAPAAPEPPVDDRREEGALENEIRELVAEVRCFRARLAEALDLACERALEDIASDVLARELATAPADLAAIVARVCAEHAENEIVGVRAHPDEIAALDGCGIAVTADSRLRRGDCTFDLRDGAIDATLGVRLAAVVRVVNG